MLPMARKDIVRFDSFWHLQLLGWGSFYVWGIVGNIPDLMNRPGAFRANTSVVAIMFLATFLLRPLCRNLLRRYYSLLAFELRVGVSSLVLGNVAAVVTSIVLDGFHKLVWMDLAPGSMEATFVLFMWCSLYFSIKQWQQSGQEKQRLLSAEAAAREAQLRAEAEVREAKLRALRYQLNPHFLFNSLNAVSTLVVEENVVAATRMLAQIGELLRTTLDSELVTEATLSQELAFTERYLAIEQTRLGERLQFALFIPSHTLDALVPSMLLQPLVENAVRHGVAPLVEGGKIRIESTLNQDRLRIVVGNSGRRSPARQTDSGNGIGLTNTAERLKALYGTNHMFRLEWPESGGCEVIVELPFRRVAQSQEALPCVP
jgi:two-component system, LytTR family, sensor kinase